MSFLRDNEPIHNKVHLIEIEDENNTGRTSSLNITVRKNYDGILLIKLRDEKNLLFNYTTVINRNNFQYMKKEQSLDIDFDEFERHLMEMLLSNLSKEMLMKCEVNSDGSKCRMIFYEKSKIKNLILLSVEMGITSQKDIFEEMETNMKTLQETNKGLVKQVKNLSEKLSKRENEVYESKINVDNLQTKFKQDMQKLNQVFFYCLQQCEFLLTAKVAEVSGRIVKVISDINIMKNENYSKSESNSRLMEVMEKLRLDNTDNHFLIDKLKMECTSLERINKNLESEVRHLTLKNKENDKKIFELEEQIAEFRNDLENSAIAIAKKTEQYDELKEDMDQANQVIRNYNKHYDAKAQQVEELEGIIKSKDKVIKDQIFQNNLLFKEFHEYKMQFNREEMEKIMIELSTVQEKSKTLEKEKREMVKLNGLLTKKISSSTMFADQRN